MTKQELYNKLQEYKQTREDKDERLEILQEKLDRIKSLAEGLGTLPTLSKLREFLQTIKELVNQQSD